MVKIMVDLMDDLLELKGFTRDDLSIKFRWKGKRYKYPMYTLPWWVLRGLQVTGILLALWGLFCGLFLMGG